MSHRKRNPSPTAGPSLPLPERGLIDRGLTDRPLTSRGTVRRRLMGSVGAFGASLGTPLLLAGCGSEENDSRLEKSVDEAEQRTLFFNLAHVGEASTTHYLYAAGRKHVLTPVADNPEVLRQARTGNEFLRSVPDDSITHHLEDVLFPTAAVSLNYLTCNESAETGTWELTSYFFHIPSASVSKAYAHARTRSPSGELPLSNKRHAYGVRAAVSEQDMRDEHALVDLQSHAEALIGLHPDILSIEPNSAAAVHGSYVSVNGNARFLGGYLQTLGPAVPQGQANISGKQPWATLVPITDTTRTPPVPLKRSGNLNQYHPDWAPRIDQLAAAGMQDVQPLVRNDESLGADFTGITQANPMPDKIAIGKLWGRHDGTASILHAAVASASDAPAYTFKNQGAETGLKVWDPSGFVTLGDGRVQVTLDGVQNWFLRWLGMWVQFLDANGQVIKVANLPHDTLSTGLPALNKEDALFAGMLPPPTSIWGVPVAAGKFVPVVKIPKDAHTMRIFYGGLGAAGSTLPDAPAGVIGAGIGMTVTINYGIVGLFMVGGVTAYSPFFAGLGAIGTQIIAADLVQLIGTVLDGGTFDLKPVMLNVLRLLCQGGGGSGAAAMMLLCKGYFNGAEVLDAIPIAGEIMRAFAAAVGALQLAETSIEALISPPVYQFDLALSHDLSVQVLPDKWNNQFPQPSSGQTLYYKVTYLFDQGSTHVQEAVDVDAAVKAIDILLKGIPRGGMVNIKIGFYFRSSGNGPGQNDWCAGYGSTGLIDNTLSTAPPITIKQTKIPIQASTRYLHTRKSRLDVDNRHQWFTTAVAPPYAIPPGGQEPSLGDFRAITVRQATSQPVQAGYVGYAWRSSSDGVPGCGSTFSGQFDHVANLNTDASDGGVHAQDGYASGSCGLPAGVTIAYDLLDQQGRNFYLDTSSRHIRQVQLASPTGFALPGAGQSGGGQAFGQLNLDSTRLLLHPAGHVVSINNEHHKLEILRLPAAALTDADASLKLIARTFSGWGTRPGLMTSPVAAAVSPEGAILVVEGIDGNSRIQAFDLGGSSLPYFKQQAKPYFLPLTAITGNQILDLAVEFTGYLYVLSKDASNNHRLDIFHPGQTGTQPISTTQGVNAAKLAVDLWRSVYTLNYELLRLPDNTVPGLAEPSVSLWVPDGSVLEPPFN